MFVGKSVPKLIGSVMLNAHTKGCRRTVEIHFHVLSARLERVEDARRRKFSFAIVRVDYSQLPYGITPARGDIADTNIHVHCLYICHSVMTHNPAR